MMMRYILEVDANRIKQIQARHKMEIQDSLEKQRNELLDNIADSDKADLLKRIETLKLEVQKYQQRLDDNDFNGYNDSHYKNTLSDKNDVAPDVVEDFKLRTCMLLILPSENVCDRTSMRWLYS